MKKGMGSGSLTWLIPAVVVLISSCTKPAAPKGILEKGEMVKVMMEIYIAEERVNRLSLPRDSGKKVFDSLQVRFMKKAGIQDSVFQRSLAYYVDRPVEMELIYTALVDSLQLREQRVISNTGIVQ